MFVTALSTCGSAQEMGQKIDDCQLTWLCVERYKSDGINGQGEKWFNGPQLRDEGNYTYRQTLREKNCALWLWGWPAPIAGGDQVFIEAMTQSVSDFGAVGLIIDCEKEWKGVPESTFEALLTGLQKIGVPVGVTSYGGAYNFPTLPWAAFAKASFGVPQIYDSNNNLGPSYPSKAENAWTEKGFAELVPASGAYRKTPDQMRELLSNTPVPAGAILWWSWGDASHTSDAWGVIQDYTIPC